MCGKIKEWFTSRTLEDWLYFGVVIVLISFILLLTVTWATGINSQFYGLIIKASESGSEGYTPDFERNLTAFALSIKDYGNIALTFFGFTFIGGIFNLRKGVTNEDRMSRRITIMIFSISIVFLFCFMTLQLIYSLIYPYITSTSENISTLLSLGLSLFVIAVNLLLYILIFYLISLIRISGKPKS
jgi:hypothetical protein